MGRRYILSPLRYTDILPKKHWSTQVNKAFRMGISNNSTVASLHSVNSKPLETVVYCLLVLSQYVFAVNIQLRASTSLHPANEWPIQERSRGKEKRPFTQIPAPETQSIFGYGHFLWPFSFSFLIRAEPSSREPGEPPERENEGKHCEQCTRSPAQCHWETITTPV